MRKNIIFRGLEIKENEARLGLREIIQKEIREKLGIVNAKTKTVRSLGKDEGNRQRPILLEMEDVEGKIEIMKNRTKLKGTKIFLEDDLDWESRQIQRKLIEIAKTQRERGKKAKVVTGMIWIDNEGWVWNREKEDLEKKVSAKNV
jgi:hypothetical protein